MIIKFSRRIAILISYFPIDDKRGNIVSFFEASKLGFLYIFMEMV